MKRITFLLTFMAGLSTVRFGLAGSEPNTATQWKNTADQLQNMSNQMHQKGDQNKQNGQMLTMAGKGLQMTGLGILVGGEAIKDAGIKLISDGQLQVLKGKAITSWACGNPATAAKCAEGNRNIAMGNMKKGLGTGMKHVGENKIAYGLGSMAAGMGMDVAGTMQQNKGDGEKADGNNLNSKAGQSRNNADERRQLSLDTGFISDGNQNAQEYEFNRVDLNGDGTLSPDEVRSATDSGVLEGLSRHGQLDSAINGALGEGDLSAKLKDLFSSNYPLPGTPEFAAREKAASDDLKRLEGLAQEQGIDLSQLGIDLNQLGQDQDSTMLAAMLDGNVSQLQGLDGASESGKSEEQSGKEASSEASVSGVSTSTESGTSSFQSSLQNVLNQLGFGGGSSKGDQAKNAGTHLGKEADGWLSGSEVNSVDRRPAHQRSGTSASVLPHFGMPFLFKKVNTRYQKIPYTDY